MDILTAHQALSDPVRLWIAHTLLTRDLSPGEIRDASGQSTALVAHHLKVLDAAGLVRRTRGEHDARKTYVSLRSERPDVVALVAIGAPTTPAPRRVAFVCTRNSARSKLAAALWGTLSSIPAVDAGTSPAPAPHPEAVIAAGRHGLTLDHTPHAVEDTLTADDLVIAVCDHVHETLPAHLDRWHWSIPDPVPRGAASAFDEACATLTRRVHHLHQSLSA